MTKINQEEYEILKGLDDKWKWIAKDDNYGGFIFCFREKPHKDIRKGGWSPDTTQYKCLWEYDVLFQFIQWADEEPHNIQELIEEYEHKEFYDYVGWKYAESEEAEVERDTEWLKREIHKELEDWHGVEGGIDGDGINEIILLINQHEESEVKQLERKIKELDSYNDELIRDNNQFRNELDNQEVLSEEWIDENKKYNGVHDIGYYIPVDKLYGKIVSKQEDMFNGEEPGEGEVYFAVGLEGAVEVNSASNIDEAIERLAEHETSYNILKKPAIPKFIAEAIEEGKERGYDVYDSIDLIIETNGGGLPSLSDWVAINIDKYARAWLNGYMVAEEQKFYVKDKKGNTLLKKVTEGFGIVDRTGEVVNSSDVGEVSDLRLTEQEIKEYDPRYMTFAKPVEELEEE